MEQNRNSDRVESPDAFSSIEEWQPPEPGTIGDLYSSPSDFKKPHPAHGPVSKLPRRADGSIDPYYYFSPDQIREFGFYPGMADRPPPEPPKPTGTGFFYKDGREMPPTHPDHGPMGDIPVEESARVSAYYYCSKEELDAFGIDGPPPRRTRVDGWTESCQRNFVKTLAATGTWSGAAAVVGRSRQSAAKLYNRSPAFRAACDEALRAVKFVLHATALERAVEGVREPVFYKGERVGERTRYNDRLLMFLLKARDPLNFAPLSELEGWLRHRPPTPDGGLDDALDRLEASEKAWEQRLPGEEIRPRTIAHPEPAGLPGSGAGAEQAIGLSEPSEAEVGPPPVSLSGGGPVLEPPGPHT